MVCPVLRCLGGLIYLCVRHRSISHELCGPGWRLSKLVGNEVQWSIGFWRSRTNKIWFRPLRALLQAHKYPEEGHQQGYRALRLRHLERTQHRPRPETKPCFPRVAVGRDISRMPGTAVQLRRGTSWFPNLPSPWVAPGLPAEDLA